MRPAVYCICRWHCKTSINYFIATVIVGAAAATAVRRAFYEFIRACHIRLHTHTFMYIYSIYAVCVCVQTDMRQLATLSSRIGLLGSKLQMTL